jgi:hypothetical protein
MATLARVHAAQGDSTTADRWASQALTLAEQTFGPDHPTSVALRAGIIDHLLPTYKCI